MFFDMNFPRHPLTDILHYKKYRNIHNKYLSLAQHILNNQYPDCKTPEENTFHQLCAINKVIRFLSLNIQQDIIRDLIQYGHYSSAKESTNHPAEFIPYFVSSDFICPRCGCFHQNELSVIQTAEALAFNIALHPALSFPHRLPSLINTFGNIGSLCDNTFHFNEKRHKSYLLEPINLLIVTGRGYHSSTSGIYDQNSVHYPETIYDISDLFNEIYFDGIAFRHIKCHSVLDYPICKSSGTIFEIGRLLFERNLSLLSLF